MKQFLTISVLAICFVFVVSQTTKAATSSSTTTKKTTPTSTTTKSASTTNSVNLTSAFVAYKNKYAKTYPNVSVQVAAQNTYTQNKAAIDAHNANKSKTYTQAENEITDLSYSQAVKAKCGLNATLITKDKNAKSGNITVKSKKGSVSINPAALGYNKTKKESQAYLKKAVVASMDLTSKFPPIRNQGNCGSCWAFHTAGIVDNWAYKQGQTTIYSEQSLLDCSGAGR